MQLDLQHCEPQSHTSFGVPAAVGAAPKAIRHAASALTGPVDAIGTQPPALFI
jgi:hypothetical protein